MHKVVANAVLPGWMPGLARVQRCWDAHSAFSSACHGAAVHRLVLQAGKATKKSDVATPAAG